MSLWTNVQPHLNVVVMCGPLQVMCGLGRPIQSDLRSSQGDVWYSYAYKLVICGDVRILGRQQYVSW